MTRNITSKKSEKGEKFDVKVLNQTDRLLELQLFKANEENKKLREELENMREINKKLLETYQMTDEEYKGFYQTIMVDHLQKKVDNLGVEANFYRLEYQKNSMELDYLKKDKKYIRALAEKYKKLSVDKNIKNSPSKNLTPRDSEKSKALVYNFEKKISNLVDFLKNIEGKSDLLSLLSSIAGFLQKNLRAEKVSMLLASDEIKELYAKQVKNFFKHN